MELRLPVLPSQCYTPMPDYSCDAASITSRQSVSSGGSSSRQPLSEATGNPQSGLGAGPYSHRLDDFTTLPSIPVPPILPSQAVDSLTYGGPTSHASRLRQRHLLHLQSQRKRHGLNPIWLSTEFQKYRKKQAEKDDKSDQKWPDVLEEAFLDALLLIPQLGRRKFTMRGQQHGRNMLISHYLWIAYCQSLAPGALPDKTMWRERKQVSSHIQVLKNFFAHHPCYHFFFPSREVKDRKEDKMKETIELESFKKHPVLIALSEGRLPDERPNYEYFTQLLASDSLVTVRPRRFWLFVTHSNVVVRDDGTGVINSLGAGQNNHDDPQQQSNEVKLTKEAFPHLEKNLRRDEWAKEEQLMVEGTMLHELAREHKQVEATALKDVAQEWETDFPELHSAYLEPLLQTGVSTEPQCDILHSHTVLELQGDTAIPGGAGLNACVEIAVAQQAHALLKHRWKVVTRLSRPAELADDDGSGDGDGGEATICKMTQEMPVHYTHGTGCNGKPIGDEKSCVCGNPRERPVISVPFPADLWARMITNAGAYPAHPLVGQSKKAGSGGRSSSTRNRTAVKREEDDDQDDEKYHSHPRRKRGSHHDEATQMDLVRKIAMYQEIWSCPSDRAIFGGPAQPDTQRWTRRAVILSDFETVHSISEKGELRREPCGRTSWRFLTAIDPTSQYHRQQALISADAPGSSGNSSVGMGLSMAMNNTLSRDAVMSPSPNFHQQLTAGMSENFHAAWENSVFTTLGSSGHGLYQTSAGPSGPGAINILDSFHSSANGLATPPPTASLSSSFGHSFDCNSQGLGSFTAPSAAGVDTDSHLASVTRDHHFLGDHAYSSGGMYADPSELHGWDTTGWSHTLSSGSALVAHGLDWHTTGTAGTTSTGAGSLGVAGVADGRELWAPAPAAASNTDTPGCAADGQEQAWHAVPSADSEWEEVVPPPPSQNHTHCSHDHRHKDSAGNLSDLGFSLSPLKHAAAAPENAQTLASFQRQQEHQQQQGRKRSRSDSVEDGDKYPLASIMKLDHKV